MADSQFEFFPQNRALCLTGSDEYSTDSKVDELLKKVDVLLLTQAKEEIEKQKQIELERQKRWQEKHKMNVMRKRASGDYDGDAQHDHSSTAHRVHSRQDSLMSDSHTETHHDRRKTLTQADKDDRLSEKSDVSKDHGTESSSSRKHSKAYSPSFSPPREVPALTRAVSEDHGGETKDCLTARATPTDKYLFRAQSRGPSKVPSVAHSTIEEHEADFMEHRDSAAHHARSLMMPKASESEIEQPPSPSAMDAPPVHQYPSQDPLQFLESLSISSGESGDESTHPKGPDDDDKVDLVKL